MEILLIPADRFINDFGVLKFLRSQILIVLSSEEEMTVFSSCGLKITEETDSECALTFWMKEVEVLQSDNLNEPSIPQTTVRGSLK